MLDSLDLVELLARLEESGFEITDAQFARLQPFLVSPYQLQWQRGSLLASVEVIAQQDCHVLAIHGFVNVYRLGWGDHTGEELEAQRMFFGRLYVLDKPKAFEHEHNYNTCRFWCWTMGNGMTELQATGGPAKGFRFDPALGRYDLFTYCESPIDFFAVLYA
jgi:hypothetical protein